MGKTDDTKNLIPKIMQKLEKSPIHKELVKAGAIDSGVVKSYEIKFKTYARGNVVLYVFYLNEDPKYEPTELDFRGNIWKP